MITNTWSVKDEVVKFISFNNLTKYKRLCVLFVFFFFYGWWKESFFLTLKVIFDGLKETLYLKIWGYFCFDQTGDLK